MKNEKRSNHANLDTTVDLIQLRRLALEEKIGAGNFLEYALSLNPNPDAAILFLETKYQFLSQRKKNKSTSLSLNDLKSERDAFAAWYVAKGVKPKDPVGVYLDDGIEYFIHFLALTSIGAIPVLTNGNLSPELASLYFNKVGVTAIFTDSCHKDSLLENINSDLGYNFVATYEEVQNESHLCSGHVNYYQHHDADPIMIAHSSGTTGIPKAVLLQHQPFFHGVRYRLGVPSTSGVERILSALPHSHNCAMSYVMLALLCGNQVFILSDHGGPNLAKAIKSFSPSMVVAFPQTYVEFTELSFTAEDAESVSFWFNGGDAAHEQHIRYLVSLGRHFDGDHLVSGSIFIDGMGSSEMGFSLFRNAHTKDSSNYGRCVGSTLPWAEAAIIGSDDQILDPGVVGRLAVKAYSVTSGYWNDSNLTQRTIVKGFWLTDDLAYRDEANRFYHVDRTPDLVRRVEGPLYTLATEELLLKMLPYIADCSVIAVDDPKNPGYQVGLALVRLREKMTDLPQNGREFLLTLNRVLTIRGFPLLASARISKPEDIPLGATGKVLKKILRQRYRDYLCKEAREMSSSVARENTSIL